MAKVRTTVEIYALLVCFVTLTCLMITSGTFIYNLVKLKWPELGLCTRSSEFVADYCYDRTQENFVSHYNEVTKDDEKKLTDDEIVQKYFDSKHQYERSILIEKNRIIESIIKKLIIIFLSIVVFVPHWLLARRK